MKKFFITTAKTAAFFIGWALLAGLLPLPASSSAAVWRFWAELIPFLSVAALTLAFWLPERKTLALHLVASPCRDAAMGAGLGVVWLGSVAAALWLLQAMKPVGYHAAPMLWLWFLSLFINTAMQELLVRGYLYQMLKSSGNMAVASAVTTALFVLMHGGALEAGAIAVLNVLSMSLLMTFVLEYTRSLLVPTVMHFVWNGVGALVLGGVSLAEDYPHLLKTEFVGSEWLSGGAQKLEGSAVTLIVNIALAAIFGYLLLKRHKRGDQEVTK